MQDLVLFKIDVNTKAGKELINSYAMYATPAFIVTLPSGETINRWIGYEGPREWVETLKDVLADPTTVAEKEKRFAEHPTAEDAIKLGKLAYYSHQNRKAIELYRRAQEMDPPHAQDMDILIFKASYWGRNEGMTLEELMEAADWVVKADSTRMADIFAVADYMQRVAEDKGDSSIMIPYLQHAINQSEGVTDSLLLEERNRLLPVYALIVENDPEKAVIYRKHAFPPGWESDPDSLNRFAWWCFKNRVNLVEADILARQAVTLTEDPERQARILDTLAEIVNTGGDTEQAVILLERAVALNPTREYLHRQLEKFRKMKEEKNE